ncbi:MAG: hypothetical protein H0T72_13380 [Chloroflexia bacterium]|nr:hypothetical protein [Chloroflexia bacterium]
MKPPTTAAQLDHVYWIGGSPCAGKTSVATAIVARFGMTSYNCDDAFEIHERIVDPGQFPTLHRLSRHSCDDLWMRPIDRQIREEGELYREEFSLILDDLGNLPSTRPILAEGSALMPELLETLNLPNHRAIWLVPTPELQRAHYARRDWVPTFLAGCTDQAQAWHNWMERDIGFAALVVDRARALGRTLITVDGSQPLGAILDQVLVHFGLADPDPASETLAA